jgi:hypothetical protein
MMFSAKWYQGHVAAFAPTAFSQMVKFYRGRIMVAMQVMTQSATKFGHGLLVGFFILGQNIAS